MQQLMDGIFLGSIYALFAVGYTLVFGVLTGSTWRTPPCSPPAPWSASKW